MPAFQRPQQWGVAQIAASTRAARPSSRSPLQREALADAATATCSTSSEH
jgi:hypothetical protein